MVCLGRHLLRRHSHLALAHFASHRCGPSSIPGLGRGRMCEKFHQFLAVGRWFPPGTPVSSTRKLISPSSFNILDMTLAVAEALNPNKPNLPWSSVRLCGGPPAVVATVRTPPPFLFDVPSVLSSV